MPALAPPPTPRGPLLRRRSFLAALGAGVGLFALPPAGRRAGAAGPRLLRAMAGEAELLEIGGPKTAIWAYEGQVPGPLLHVRQGEEVFVRLDNRLAQPTTIHWHGIRLDNAMDGVPHLTQAAVAPGESFDYRFVAPDAGTFWYHPHERSWEQVARGLYGILIVNEPEPPAVDRDLVLVVDDWRLEENGAIHEASFGHMMDWSHAGRLGNILTLNGRPELDLPVRAGERIRLRLCNTANARILDLRLEDHAPVLVAVDGQPVAPRPLDDGLVVLAPGQRVDLMIDMTLAPGATAAIAEVSGGRVVAGRFLYQAGPAVGGLAGRELAALPANPLPARLDLETALRVELLMEGGAMGGMGGAMRGGRRMGMRDLVAAGQVWAFNGVAGHGEAPLFAAARGRTVLLDMINDTRWPHAMHLHGHHFQALGPTSDPAGPGVWRDTLLMAPNERATVAFVADNPGRWMLHCHMLEHQAAGMTTWFEVA